MLPMLQREMWYITSSVSVDIMKKVYRESLRVKNTNSFQQGKDFPDYYGSWNLNVLMELESTLYKCTTVQYDLHPKIELGLFSSKIKRNFDQITV